MDSTVRGSLNPGQDLPRPGEMVCGKYRIDSIVGTGGMGIVMGAVDTSLGRPVAIKFLSPHKAQREGAVARFLREARAAASIQSEHVVRVFEVSTLPNGAPFIVMEHLRGADLAQLLTQRGALPVDEAADYILQTCEALGEAHARGIVHRDLKPQNLFLTQRPDGSPCVKVLDFGISKAADDGTGQTNLTSTDMVMGTPLYMSPEQVRSLKNVDHRADIWALGSILFELLTMSPIFQAPSASALCAMIAMDPPTPLRARRPQAPPELEGVILRCLHKDPAGRYQDVVALAEALVPFASERGRLSATRVSKVVKGATAPAPFGSDPMMAHQGMSPHGSFPPAQHYGTTGTGTGPTMGAPGVDHRASFVPSISNIPPPVMGPPGMHPSMHPGSGPHPTTQSTWQQTGTGTGARSGGTSGVLVAVLGVLTGLVLLAVVGGGAWWYISKKEANAATQPPAVVADGGGALPGVVPANTATTTPTTTPTTTSTNNGPRPSPTNVSKDGGAPAPGPNNAKDGGAPNPGPGPNPNGDKEEAERNAALGRAAESSCRHHTQQMTVFSRDEASRKQAATQAKGFMCRGMASSRCEREVCKNACMVLNDSNCIRDIQFVIDHGPPPKY